MNTEILPWLMHNCRDTLGDGNKIGVALTINLAITSSTRNDAITDLPSDSARMYRIMRIIPIALVSAERLRKSFVIMDRIDHSCTIYCTIISRYT